MFRYWYRNVYSNVFLLTMIFKVIHIHDGDSRIASSGAWQFSDSAPMLLPLRVWEMQNVRITVPVFVTASLTNNKYTTS